MSIFKRIFGNGTAQSDKQVEEEVNQIKGKKEIKVYPIIKPGDWPGIQAGVIKNILIGTEEKPRVVIAFGYDAPDNFHFLTPDNLNGANPDALKGVAFRNIEELTQEFVPILDGEILLSSGKDFSSEMIFNEKHMTKAQEFLNTNELLISIPRRSCMSITSLNVEGDAKVVFDSLHTQIWEDDSHGNAPIMNYYFVVIDGMIKRMIPID